MEGSKQFGHQQFFFSSERETKMFDRGIQLRQDEFHRTNSGRDPATVPHRGETTQQQQHRKRVEFEEEPNMVLYVWGDQEENSRKAIERARELNALDAMTVVDVRTLPPINIPDWLTGVPTLLCVDEKAVYRGTQCLEEFPGIASQHAARLQKYQKQQQQMLPATVLMPNREVQDSGNVEDLPRFSEPEPDSVQAKKDLKDEVEAIMARRNKLAGMEEPADKQ